MAVGKLRGTGLFNFLFVCFIFFVCLFFFFLFCFFICFFFFLDSFTISTRGNFLMLRKPSKKEKETFERKLNKKNPQLQKKKGEEKEGFFRFFVPTRLFFQEMQSKSAFSSLN